MRYNLLLFGRSEQHEVARPNFGSKMLPRGEKPLSGADEALAQILLKEVFGDYLLTKNADKFYVARRSNWQNEQNYIRDRDLSKLCGKILRHEATRANLFLSSLEKFQLQEIVGSGIHTWTCGVVPESKPRAFQGFYKAGRVRRRVKANSIAELADLIKQINLELAN